MTEPIWITCKKVREIPTFEKLSLLAVGDQHVVLEISKKNWFFNKKACVNKISKNLPEHSVFDSGGDTKNEWITIMPVVKREVVLSNEDIVKNAIEEYIKTCHVLKNKYIEEILEEDWEFNEHGLEICFTHKVTGQTVEVPLMGPITLDNIDPYFFGKFIETTSGLSVVSSLINDTFHDSARILDIIRERKQ